MAETTSPAGTSDRKSAIEALEAQLAQTPRGARPYEHAVIAYRLGLAHAEAPAGTPQEGLRKALACYDVAAAIFHPDIDPADHARVLNAAGAAHRGLGDRRKAAQLFEEAARLLDGRERDPERAAALNNLGLVRTELDQPADAVEAFDASVELFDVTTADGRRGKVAALHNRGQAHQSLGTEEGLEAALADFEEARSDLDAEEAPYHYGLVHHSIGVVCSALAARRPDDRRRFLQEAVSAFAESLTVFSRSGFPYQHGLAKHNLGQAWASLGGVNNMRRALACFEDAVSVLDTRMHAEAWRMAYSSLERAEKELAASGPGLNRNDHFARLVSEAREDERATLVKERVIRLYSLPHPSSRAALTELALAIAHLGWEAREVMATVLDILMELPSEKQDAGLRAVADAHGELDGDEQEQANRALDQAIGDALGGPQRIYVRDFLVSIGWERP